MGWGMGCWLGYGLLLKYGLGMGCCLGMGWGMGCCSGMGWVWVVAWVWVGVWVVAWVWVGVCVVAWVWVGYGLLLATDQACYAHSVIVSPLENTVQTLFKTKPHHNADM